MFQIKLKRFKLKHLPIKKSFSYLVKDLKDVIFSLAACFNKRYTYVFLTPVTISMNSLVLKMFLFLIFF